tara:strand:+ start:2640 stop:3422 length:783 start_codon:yes stop_codon:yes gene_type:complete
MENIRELRQRLRKGTPCFGTFLVEMNSSGVVATMANCGFDFFMIDLEHGALDLSDVTRMIDVGKCRGLTPLVRVPLRSPGLFAAILDGGAEGIIVPQIRTMAEVQTAVKLTKYPPLGERGVHLLLPHTNFTIPPDKATYLNEANQQLATLIQIETVEAVTILDEIAATQGVDGLYIGPDDLETSMRNAGNTDPDFLMKVVANVGTACRRHEKIAAIHIPKPDMLPQLMAHGFTLFGYAAALRVFAQGATALLNKMRENLP